MNVFLDDVCSVLLPYNMNYNHSNLCHDGNRGAKRGNRDGPKSRETRGNRGMIEGEFNIQNKQHYQSWEVQKKESQKSKENRIRQFRRNGTRDAWREAKQTNQH